VNDELQALRAALDALDGELAALFARRMALAQQVGLCKKRAGLPVLDAAREAQVLATRAALVTEPAWQADARAFFAELMRLSRLEQQRVLARTGEDARVAYQGLPGAYGHAAALACCGDGTATLPCTRFEDVFRAVADGQAAWGVLPLENSSAGSIADVYDLLGRYGCYIVGEVRVPVAHCLLGVPGAALADIREVRSHEQGFLQCREFLARHPDWRQSPCLNTAVAAQAVAQAGDPAVVAIAGRLAAAHYGLDVLAADIQTFAGNSTRFIRVAAHPDPDAHGDKATITFTLRHERGSLHRALAAFVALGMNLTRIESRPMPGQSWEYRFYVDAEGPMDERKLDVLMAALQEDCLDCRLLGRYPAAGGARHA
jgi:chorismate mutase/prephenate dehydratase